MRTTRRTKLCCALDIPVLVDMITKPGIDFTDVNNWPEIGDMSWSGFQKKKSMEIPHFVKAILAKPFTSETLLHAVRQALGLLSGKSGTWST